MTLWKRIYRILFWDVRAHYRGRQRRCESCGAPMKPSRNDPTILICTAWDGCEGVKVLE